jgi:hypothetical protein
LSLSDFEEKMIEQKNSSPCPVCGKSVGRDLLEIQNVPIHCNLLWADHQLAVSAPKGDIVLVFCSNCGHVFNRAFDASLTEYTQAYENSLHFSPRFQNYAHSLASDLVERHNLRQRELVEIGAGQGDFLRMLCDIGDNRGIGFDEAYVPSEGDQLDERFSIVCEFAWQEHLERTPDMIYARHVLEHIEQPADFIAVIREAIGDKPDTLLFLEVPNMAYTLRELAIWDIIYEHCGYYTPQSISCLLTRGGFDVPLTRDVFEGQFLTAEAFPAGQESNSDCADQDDLHEIASQVDAFADEFRQKVEFWQQRVQGWQNEGKRVVAWGAGSKGVTFLNILKAKEQIPYIVDINPRKLGKYVVGTGQEIVAPEFLRGYQPDVVILMNPIYRDEIAQMLEELDVTADLVVA